MNDKWKKRNSISTNKTYCSKVADSSRTVESGNVKTYIHCPSLTIFSWKKAFS